jgi:hypothetical protein
MKDLGRVSQATSQFIYELQMADCNLDDIVESIVQVVSMFSPEKEDDEMPYVIHRLICRYLGDRLYRLVDSIEALSIYLTEHGIVYSGGMETNTPCLRLDSCDAKVVAIKQDKWRSALLVDNPDDYDSYLVLFRYGSDPALTGVTVQDKLASAISAVKSASCGDRMERAVKAVEAMYAPQIHIRKLSGIRSCGAAVEIATQLAQPAMLAVDADPVDALTFPQFAYGDHRDAGYIASFRRFYLPEKPEIEVDAWANCEASSIIWLLEEIASGYKDEIGDQL